MVGATGEDLSGAEEAAIGAAVLEKTGSELVFITHYPTACRPFYAMEAAEEPDLTVSFDLLFRGVEIVTGGQRIHERSALVAKMRRMGLQTEPFAFFHQTHGYGLPPHVGSEWGWRGSPSSYSASATSEKQRSSRAIVHSSPRDGRVAWGAC